MRAIIQRLGGVEQDARQLRLTTEADVPTDAKTCKHMEDDAADQVKYRNSYSGKRIDAGPPMCLTSFGNDFTESPALPCCRDDAMVDKGTAAPKTCLSPVEMRTPTAVGGLLPAGMASIVTQTTLHQLPL